MTQAIDTIRTLENVTPECFREEVYPAAEPVVMKGLVADWPAVRAGRKSADDLTDYLNGLDNGQPVETLVGRPEIGGRFFYNEAMDGLNFGKRPQPLAESLRAIMDLRGQEHPPAIYVQSTPVADLLPGFAADQPMNLVPDGTEPRIWVGNRLTVQTHFDLKENIACVVSGRRRFTLFPPEQTPNLYIGPFLLTPAGTPVSMVNLDQPDLDAYPRFAEAQKHARQAELEPGDALYIPYFWWHHVQSLDDFNVLVNYWWNEANADLGSPFEAMLHSLLALRDLPERQREAWRTMFDTYVFGRHGDPVAHLPPEILGPLGPHDAKTRQNVRMLLLRSIGRAAGIQPPRKGS